MSTPSTGLHLFHGGPLDRLERRARVVRGEDGDVLRQTLLFLAVGWAPVALLALAGDASQRVLRPDFHVRWLIAVPFLFVAQGRLDERIQSSINYLEKTDIVPASEREKLRSVQQLVERLRDSWVVELALLLISVGVGLFALRTPLPAALVWNETVSLPLFRFLVMRFLWRWLLWMLMLRRVSQLDLQLRGTHPDGYGGLGVFWDVSRGLSHASFAVASVYGAKWMMLARHGEAQLADLRDPIAVLVLLVLLLGMGPMQFFARAVRRARDRFILEYGAFVDGFAEAFDERWLRRAPKDALGHPDPSSFADLDSVYAAIQRMKLVMFDRDILLYLVVWTLLPIVPIYLISLPMSEILSKLLEILV